MRCKNCEHDIFEIETGIWEHSESFEGSKRCEAEDGDCNCIKPTIKGKNPSDSFS